MSNKKTHHQLQGKVVSNKMSKTIVVEVGRLKEHPRYKKRIRVSKKFKAHDEKNECQIGDLVLIEQCRPLSKDKKWRLSKIIRTATTNDDNQKSENSNLAEIGA